MPLSIATACTEVKAATSEQALLSLGPALRCSWSGCGCCWRLKQKQRRRPAAPPCILAAHLAPLSTLAAHLAPSPAVPTPLEAAPAGLQRHLLPPGGQQEAPAPEGAALGACGHLGRQQGIASRCWTPAAQPQTCRPASTRCRMCCRSCPSCSGGSLGCVKGLQRCATACGHPLNELNCIVLHQLPVDEVQWNNPCSVPSKQGHTPHILLVHLCTCPSSRLTSTALCLFKCLRCPTCCPRLDPQLHKRLPAWPAWTHPPHAVPRGAHGGIQEGPGELCLLAASCACPLASCTQPAAGSNASPTPMVCCHVLGCHGLSCGVVNHPSTPLSCLTWQRLLKGTYAGPSSSCWCVWLFL
jgi:hypothetical protein